MVIIGDSLQYLENLELNKKKALFSGENCWRQFVGEKRQSIDTLVEAFNYFFLS